MKVVFIASSTERVSLVHTNIAHNMVPKSVRVTLFNSVV